MTKQPQQQDSKTVFVPLQGSIKINLNNEELTIYDGGCSVKKLHSNQVAQQYDQDSPEYLRYLNKAQDFALQQTGLNPNSTLTNKIIGQVKQSLQDLAESSVIKTASAFMILADQISLASAQNFTQSNSTKITDNSDDEKTKAAGITVAAIIAAAAIIIVSYRIYEKLTENKQTNINNQTNHNDGNPYQAQSEEQTTETSPITDTNPRAFQEAANQESKNQAESSIIYIPEPRIKAQDFNLDIKKPEQNYQEASSSSNKYQPSSVDKTSHSNVDIKPKELPVKRSFFLDKSRNKLESKTKESEIQRTNISCNTNSSIEANQGSPAIKTIELQTQDGSQKDSSNDNTHSVSSIASLTPRFSIKATSIESTKQELKNDGQTTSQ